MSATEWDSTCDWRQCQTRAPSARSTTTIRSIKRCWTSASSLASWRTTSWRICSSASVVTANRSTRGVSCRGCVGSVIESVNSLSKQSRATTIDRRREWSDPHRRLEGVFCLGESALDRESFRRAERMRGRALLRDYSQLRVGGSLGETRQHLRERQVDFGPLKRRRFMLSYIEQLRLHDAAFPPLGKAKPKLVVFRRVRLRIEPSNVGQHCSVDHDRWQCDVGVVREHVRQNPPGPRRPRLECVHR